MARRTFRFRPRYRGLALGALAIGAVLVAVGFTLDGSTRTLAFAGGGLGMVLGGLYLRSPAWRIAVHVDDESIEVTAGGARRFLLAWGDVVEVVASPSTRTCFVDGGEPERSLLVPGDGAPAPYDIEDKAGLFDFIVAHVGNDRIREVEILQKA
jgi:hypothetical protein